MKNKIPLPAGNREWRARQLSEPQRTDYLFKQVVFSPESEPWYTLWTYAQWHAGATRPGFIVDPLFTSDSYRVYFWKYDSFDELFVPVVDETPEEIEMSNLFFFHFFPDRLVVPAFKALKEIR